MKDDILHAPIPKGPGGQFNLPGVSTDLLMGYSKNQKAAKDFLRWVSSKPIFEQWFTSQQGFNTGPTPYWEEDPVWSVDPVLLPFRISLARGGWSGMQDRLSQGAAEVVTKYIIVDMYAKAVQGMPAEDAVKWAHDELVKIYDDAVPDLLIRTPSPRRSRNDLYYPRRPERLCRLSETSAQSPDCSRTSAGWRCCCCCQRCSFSGSLSPIPSSRVWSCR